MDPRLVEPLKSAILGAQLLDANTQRVDFSNLGDIRLHIFADAWPISFMILGVCINMFHMLDALERSPDPFECPVPPLTCILYPLRPGRCLYISCRVLPQTPKVVEDNSKQF